MIGWLTIDGPGVPLVAENLSRFTGFNIALKGGSTGAARIHGVNTAVLLQVDADGDVDTPTDSALVDSSGSGLAVFKSRFRNHRAWPEVAISAW